MLELDFDNLKQFKNNLLLRKVPFTIEKKRNEVMFISNGKKIAKAESINSISNIKKNQTTNILSLFANVKKSINKFIIKNNCEITKIEKEYDSTFTNRLLFDSLPIGTNFYYLDVKHCYWRIAYLNGYISENYYKKILENPDLKIYRNMALSCIIAPKSVEYYENGELINVITEDTGIYHTIYENIRFKAWNIFGSLCFEKIGKEKTIGYYTDGIMVLSDDVAIVKTTLSRNKLQFRITKCIKTKDRQWLNCDTNEFRRF
jgi:TusA-related sulfurtransferase